MIRAAQNQRISTLRLQKGRALARGGPPNPHTPLEQDPVQMGAAIMRIEGQRVYVDECEETSRLLPSVCPSWTRVWTERNCNSSNERVLGPGLAYIRQLLAVLNPLGSHREMWY